MNNELKHLCERIAVIEGLLKHIIDNDLKHIWKLLFIILGAIVSTLLGVILTFFLK